MTDEWAEHPPAIPPGFKVRAVIGIFTFGAATGATAAFYAFRWLA